MQVLTNPTPDQMITNSINFNTQDSRPFQSNEQKHALLGFVMVLKH